MEQTQNFGKKKRDLKFVFSPSSILKGKKVPRKGENFNMSSRKLNIVYHFYLQILIYVLKLYIHKSEGEILIWKAIIYSSTFKGWI